MIVPSVQFLAFAALSAIVFNLGRSTLWRQAILLAVNVAFLASFSHDPLAFLPFAGFIAYGFAAQRVARNGSAPRLFVLLIVLTLLAFFWLKRYGFIPHAAFLPFPYLLVGLSYVFFRVLHLIIDSHQGAVAEPVGLLSYLNYTLNFTSLTSGPIQRYQDYRQTEIVRMPLTIEQAGGAFERIVLGTFKVAIVSLVLSLVQHHAIDSLPLAGQNTPRAVLWGALTAATYPVYLYFNFSGYVDVVIGVARFFRIVLPENFDRPFSSENFLAFWSRWHMTLSNWLKTYVFNPLLTAGMTRITAPAWTPYLAVGAFFVTFFLVGLWHGQTSEFLFFGLLQGGGVAANKLYQVVMQRRLGRRPFRALQANYAYRVCARGLTFTWFAFTLLWFWSNWGQIGALAHQAGTAGSVLAFGVIFACATIVLEALEQARNASLHPIWGNAPAVRSRYVRTAWSTALVVVTVTVVTLLDSPAPDIVYKTF